MRNKAAFSFSFQHIRRAKKRVDVSLGYKNVIFCVDKEVVRFQTVGKYLLVGKGQGKRFFMGAPTITSTSLPRLP